MLFNVNYVVFFVALFIVLLMFWHPVYIPHCFIVTDTKSLSNACQRYLGKSLNKFEQLSDWNSRTLTESQQHYAALDAHSLLAILDVLLLEKQIVSDVLTLGATGNAGTGTGTGTGGSTDGNKGVSSSESVLSMEEKTMKEALAAHELDPITIVEPFKTPLNIALECYNCTEHVKGSVALLRTMAEKERRKFERKRGKLTLV